MVGGVHLSDSEGHFDYAKAVRLTYNVRDGQVANVSRLWRHRLTEFLTNKSAPASGKEFYTIRSLLTININQELSS